MSDLRMQGNPYYEEVQKVCDYYERRNVETDTDVIALGRMNATLALAFEQRTANLIALESLLERCGSDVELDAIQERLGLNV